MDDLIIRRKNEYLENVIQESASLSLLARGSGIELMKQTVNKGKTFYLYPGENEEVIEFFYVLKGEMKCESRGIILGPDDSFSVQGLANVVFFTAITDVTFLWFINEPTFKYVSEEISTLLEVVKKVEQKDRYTVRHSERVQNYSIKIGRKLNLSKEELDNLIVASGLHDVGKINVPEEILNKPSSLSDEEFAIIKKHPADGAEMVKDTYYSEISTIIHQHHERLNGSGYPEGLTGDEITLCARIIGVSDTFDAMTDDRSYREAYSAEYAMDELKRLSGTHYDPDIVQAFNEVLVEDGIINK